MDTGTLSRAIDLVVYFLTCYAWVLIAKRTGYEGAKTWEYYIPGWNFYRFICASGMDKRWGWGLLGIPVSMAFVFAGVLMGRATFLGWFCVILGGIMIFASSVLVAGILFGIYFLSARKIGFPHPWIYGTLGLLGILSVIPAMILAFRQLPPAPEK